MQRLASGKRKVAASAATSASPSRKKKSSPPMKDKSSPSKKNKVSPNSKDRPSSLKQATLSFGRQPLKELATNCEPAVHEPKIVWHFNDPS
eukprot:6187352-Pleurochrysis_carterae.AAC.1